MTTSALQIDVLLDPFGTHWSEVRDAAFVAVDAGFRGIWTYDHVDGRVYDNTHVLECWTVLSALAATVPGVVLGPMVLNVANRHPGILATMAATLQEVSDGRLLIGLGAGAHPDSRYSREQEAIGRPVFGDAERREQVEHCVAELHRLWRAPSFLQPDREPPVIIAAFGSKMAELAGRLGNGLNTRATHPRLRDLVATARRASPEPDEFLVTMFADFDERWLDPDDPGRRQLDELATHRLVLAMPAPYDHHRLTAAGRLIGR
jgi:alkanesulfonate monooxygenase SsuD/methylene tetrahydromethanopterin reductase-like flavin-dependent oxidoreductase (luciferase family)